MVDIESQLTQEQEMSQEEIRSNTVRVDIKDFVKLTIFFTYLFLFCGGWLSLICSIPAIYLALRVSMTC